MSGLDKVLKIKKCELALSDECSKSFSRIGGKDYCATCLRKAKFRCPSCDEEKNYYQFRDRCGFFLGPESKCRDCREQIYGVKRANYQLKIKPNIGDLLEEFKKEYPQWKNLRVLDDGEFEILREYLMTNCDSGIWASTVWGFNKKSPLNHGVMLTENQVRKLFDFLKGKYGPDENLYQYCHAIASRLLLLNDVSDVYFIFNMYYSEHITEDKIMETWNSMEWLYNCTKFVIDQCGICNEDLDQKSKIARCGHCGELSHVDCKHKSLTKQAKKFISGPGITCSSCGHKYQEDSDISYINEGKFSLNKETGQFRRWCWRDYVTEYVLKHLEPHHIGYQ